MYNISNFEQKVNEITKDKIKILEFTGVKKPVSFECLECHNITKVNKGEVLLRKGKTYQCPFCHYPKESTTKACLQKLLYLAQKTNKKVISFTKVGESARFLCECCNNTFSREPARFLKNQKCPICESRCVSIPLAQFKKELLAYGSDYDIVNESQYKNLHEKILFRHKCGFIWKAKPTSVLSGRSHCPKCSKGISHGEAKIKKYLDNQKIQYIPQWERMIKGHFLFFDFFLPKDNLVIEFQGEQHYKSVDWFGGEEAFQTRKKYDGYKKDWCKENNIILLEISYRDINRIEEILKVQRLCGSSKSNGELPEEEDDIV